jgi:hypothetical protein
MSQEILLASISRKSVLDFVVPKCFDPLVPMEDRLPKELVARVNAKLLKDNVTFTELMRGACQRYLECSAETILQKKKRD